MSELAARARREFSEKRMWIGALMRCGRRTRQPLRFVVREIFMRRNPGGVVYRLRDGGVLLLRHGQDDVGCFEEVFVHEAYAPPWEAAQAIDATPVDWPVVDAGAFAGHFGLFWARLRPDRRIVAFEPDPVSHGIAAANAAMNAHRPGWIVREAAVGTAAGDTAFVAGAGVASRAASGSEATTRVPVIDLFTDVPAAALLKLDAEGAEWPLLRDDRLATMPLGALVMEWHTRPDHASPAEARSEARRLLRAAGLRVLTDDHEPDHSEGIMWAVRSAD